MFGYLVNKLYHLCSYNLCLSLCLRPKSRAIAQSFQKNAEVFFLWLLQAKILDNAACFLKKCDGILCYETAGICKNCQNLLKLAYITKYHWAVLCTHKHNLSSFGSLSTDMRVQVHFKFSWRKVLRNLKVENKLDLHL